MCMAAAAGCMPGPRGSPDHSLGCEGGNVIGWRGVEECSMLPAVDCTPGPRDSPSQGLGVLMRRYLVGVLQAQAPRL